MPLQPDEIRVADLMAWHSEFPDAVPIAQVKPRQRATCVGVVQLIRLVPGRRIEITIEDHTGRLTSIFSGRTMLAGLDLGSGMRVEGTVAVDSDHGLQMRNPAWSHVSDPYQ